MKKNCIILFVKYPQKGKVKTRLAADIGSAQATALYKNFIKDILSLTKTITSEVCILFDPPAKQSKFKKWLGPAYQYYPQSRGDLGERMKNAFIFGFNQGYANIIILGSDSPDIPPRILKSAFTTLNGQKSVVGPSYDGGYYLIGFNRKFFNPDIFTEIPWSTDRVMEKTIEKFKKNKLSFRLLPLWHDVDTYKDLAYLL
ncbi:MAG: TIGR04282 family arsenosugar biosynthesis glycosyltransferase [bacterium]